MTLHLTLTLTVLGLGPQLSQAEEIPAALSDTSSPAHNHLPVPLPFLVQNRLPFHPEKLRSGSGSGAPEALPKGPNDGADLGSKKPETTRAFRGTLHYFQHDLEGLRPVQVHLACWSIPGSLKFSLGGRGRGPGDVSKPTDARLDFGSDFLDTLRG